MIRFLLALLLMSSTANGQANKPDFQELVKPAVFAITRVMMHDVVNPPAASRFYAYCMLGAYSLVSQSDSALPSLSGFLATSRINALPSPSAMLAASPGNAGKAANAKGGSGDLFLPESSLRDKKNIDHRVAALFCILETAKQMLPSGYMIEDDLKALVSQLTRLKVSSTVIRASRALALATSAGVTRFAATDNYGKLSAKLRYTPRRGEGYWYPTPPAYMEAVEPNWKSVQPLVMDSCNQFMPAKPVPYSVAPDSDFYKLALEVYTKGKNPDAESLTIASFWDCNPFAVENAGHLSLGFKKISPGGHWMNIAAIAASSAGMSFNQTIALETAVSITLTDAFISCWDEKYRSHRIRPETFINKHIDIRWQPVLQTPPFPEYPSGHSVVSTAAAEVLTYLVGDSFSYIDDSELMFEIPARKFNSFRQAAGEASISRLYGGIHFRDAIEQGQQQGKEIGLHVVNKLRKAGMLPFSK